MQQMNDLLAHQRAIPDDDPPDVVRLDAEVRALAGALRERADGLAAELAVRRSHALRAEMRKVNPREEAAGAPKIPSRGIARGGEPGGLRCLYCGHARVRGCANRPCRGFP